MEPPAPSRPWLVRGVGVLSVLVVVGLFVVAGRSADTDGPGGNRHPAIEDIFPAPGAQAVRQSRVGVDLEVGWTAELEIDRQRIPLDQLNNFNAELGRVDDPLFRVIYDPEQGKDIEIFPQGQVCVTAYLSKIDEPDEVGITSWCWQAT